MAHIWHLTEEEQRATNPFRSLLSEVWLLLEEDSFTVPEIGLLPVVMEWH